MNFRSVLIIIICLIPGQAVFNYFVTNWHNETEKRCCLKTGLFIHTYLEVGSLNSVELLLNKHAYNYIKISPFIFLYTVTDSQYDEVVLHQEQRDTGFSPSWVILSQLYSLTLKLGSEKTFDYQPTLDQHGRLKSITTQ